MSSLRDFIKKHGLVIERNAVTGRELVDLKDLEVELTRSLTERIRRKQESKDTVEQMLTKIVEAALEDQEQSLPSPSD